MISNDRKLQVNEECISRRIILRSGLAGLAATLTQSHLIGCNSSENDEGISGEDDESISLPPLLEDPMTDMEVVDLQDASSVDRDEEIEDVMLDSEVSPDFPQRNVPQTPQLISMISSLGPLLPPNEMGLRLPEGFTARMIARSGEVVAGTGYTWHLAPDGGATYPTEDGGWIYVSNSEVSILGGTGAIRFDAQGEIVNAYPILTRTNQNCAGGVTPWHTWLSCEETSVGRVFECSPWGDQEPILRPALGSFRHEAIAVDTMRGHLYLTEDETDGGFYRFRAHQLNSLGDPDLSSGVLEVAIVSASGQVSWASIPDPEYSGDQPTRYQVTERTPFNGGEGIWFHEGVVYFSTKGDNKVWAYDTTIAKIDVIYDGSGILEGVDNLTVSCCGDVLVAEDGGSMKIVAILPNGELKALIQIEGQDQSEVTGPAFDPSGTRLYFSSQRGPSGSNADGITFEVTGPFHRTL